jgi:alpha-glucuronidase
MLRLLLIAQFVCAMFVGFASPAQAEDGYDLWLRYRALEGSARVQARNAATAIVQQSGDTTLRVAQAELQRAVAGLTGATPGIDVRHGAIVIGTAASSPIIARLGLPIAKLGPDGFLIRSVLIDGKRVTIITGNRSIGALYGTFAFIKRMQTGQPLTGLNYADAPRYRLRLVNHWDNLDGTVERGYAGPSLWDWSTLPALNRRYVDYARANASVGINGVNLNNVNADPRILSAAYLPKVAALADVFRPYGIRVYVTARFSSPKEIGGQKTADPMDPAVKAWWRAKADEIYRLIPDFGGFLVKANSEGEPGPWDYGRTQADGANVIADAVAPHGGTVFWRAFVYAATKEDRVKQAYAEFRPLDGKFRDNVIVQVKNGPIDFQPREPFSPLFGQMPKTKLGIELQLTREYLGQGDGAVFLAPMWSEALASDTCSPRCGTPVASTIAAVAGVANVGSKRGWTATDFDQANWYAFGRLAWNPTLTSRAIAEEWTPMTWGRDARAVKPITAMMLNSREAAVDYMTPLGLTHQFANDHHYGPGPWSCNLAMRSWNPCYYNNADASGIGFDRTATGSNAAAQYAPSIARKFANLSRVPDEYLLWFHHVPWTHRLRSGKTLWTGLVEHYDRGVAQVDANRRSWQKLRPFIDAERFAAVEADLHRELLQARFWRDASIAYWHSLNKLPMPAGHSSPAHRLEWYQAIRFDSVPGFKIPRIDPETLCVAGREQPNCMR